MQFEKDCQIRTLEVIRGQGSITLVKIHGEQRLRMNNPFFIIIPVYFYNPLLSTIALQFKLSLLMKISHHHIAFLLAFRPWVKLASQLRKPLADKTTCPIWVHSTSKVIPVPRCPLRQMACIPSPHVAAWFLCIPVWFIWSPVLVGGIWVIRPEVGLGRWVPLESDPNQFQWRGYFSGERQDEVVFSHVGNLDQFTSTLFAVRLGLGPSHCLVTCQVTEAVELHPSFRTQCPWKID